MENSWTRLLRRNTTVTQMFDPFGLSQWKKLKHVNKSLCGMNKALQITIHVFITDYCLIISFTKIIISSLCTLWNPIL